MELAGKIIHGLVLDVDAQVGAVSVTLNNGTSISLVDAKEFKLNVALGPIGSVVVADLSNYYTKEETNEVIKVAFDAYELKDEQIEEICV